MKVNLRVLSKLKAKKLKFILSYLTINIIECYRREKGRWALFNAIYGFFDFIKG